MSTPVRNRSEALEATEVAIHGHDAATFSDDRKARDAVLWNQTVLGEAVRGVPNEVQADTPEIPWAKMRGMRNLLVHECFGYRRPDRVGDGDDERPAAGGSAAPIARSPVGGVETVACRKRSVPRWWVSARPASARSRTRATCVWGGFGDTTTAADRTSVSRRPKMLAPGLRRDCAA